jgi:hypothetical protein
MDARLEAMFRLKRCLMRIRWTVPAADDLENIKNYLQQYYPHFAEPTVRAIYESARLLKEFPN